MKTAPGDGAAFYCNLRVLTANLLQTSMNNCRVAWRPTTTRVASECLTQLEDREVRGDNHSGDQQAEESLERHKVQRPTLPGIERRTGPWII